MSMSPNGIIAFGIAYDEEESPFYYGLDEDERFEKAEADEQELGEPIYDLGTYLLKREGKPRDYDAEKALEEAAPIEIHSYGYHEIDCWMIVLKGTFQSGPEWGAEPIEERILDRISDDYTPPTTADADLFCEKNGLPPFKNPQWLLTSSYG